MKKYTFTAHTLTACGPNFPEGKTFPARYELQDSADMKRGQLAPIVHVFATVDEKTVKIDVPSDDEYYSAAMHAAQEAAKLGEQPAHEETPVDHSSEEQPAPEAVEKRYFEVGYDTGACFSVNIIWTDCKEAEKAARATAERHAKRYGYSVAYLKEAEENSLRDNLRKGMSLVKADGETPADPSDDEQPSAEPEQPAHEETPVDHSSDEQPSAEPEQPAHEETPVDPSQDEQPTPEQADEQPAQAEQEQTEQPDETPADPSQDEQPTPEQADEQPAQAEQEQTEQPDETPVDPSQDEQPTPEQADEQPAPDPKQAHGPIPEKTFIGTSIKGARFEILFDGETQRTRVIIPAEYRDAARATVEKAGFYYSAPLDSWNKKLTFRAYRAAVALAAELEKVLAA